MATLAYPSNYTIVQSSFIDNHAEDDGGAVFIGYAGSHSRIEQTIFRNNDAADRGGAITLYGSTMFVITTNVYDNMADLGNSMCACNSEVYTSFSDGQRDHTHPECTNYNTNIPISMIMICHQFNSKVTQTSFTCPPNMGKQLALFRWKVHFMVNCEKLVPLLIQL